MVFARGALTLRTILKLGWRLCLFAALVPTSGAAVQAEVVELTQNESPPRPVPGWVRMIDHGEHDPRLAGLRTPAGVRVEVVAQEPVVVNSVGLRFSDDGTPLVLEWRFAPDADNHGEGSFAR
jgi:hypothetical protein